MSPAHQPRILVSWIGMADIKAAEAGSEGTGPLSLAVSTLAFDRVELLTDFPSETVTNFLAWLRQRCASSIRIHRRSLSGPTQFGEIYEAATEVLTELRGECGTKPRWTFYLSPGTPAMAAVWIIIAKTRFPAELIESSPAKGVVTAAVPFDISADFIPDLLRRPDAALERLTVGLPPEAPEFSDILHQSRDMRALIARARRVAPRSIPVLIEGETGTGKELLARAIHRASPRRERPFVPVNCGAIPAELVEAELFGHVKGAFTGAHADRRGYFEAAHGGTLFLDEVGELPLNTQVRLLRVLQEGEVTPVGSSESRKIDARIIAATHRQLLGGVAEGWFREDLFYRLAVAILKIPPLRARQGDVSLLVERLLAQVNQESLTELGYEPKTLSPGARNLLLNHSWPGNVRELLNTLRRAAVWSSSAVIETEEMREALLPIELSKQDRVLDRPLGQGFQLPDVLEEVARHYLTRAMQEAHGNKSEAARLLGLPSYQTLTNWLQKYRVEG